MRFVIGSGRRQEDALEPMADASEGALAGGFGRIEVGTDRELVQFEIAVPPLVVERRIEEQVGIESDRQGPGGGVLEHLVPQPAAELDHDRGRGF